MAISNQVTSSAYNIDDAPFRRLVQDAPDVIARFDRAHRYLFVNNAIEMITGLAAQEFLGKTNHELGLPQPMADRWQVALDQAWRDGCDHLFEYEVPVRSNGSGRQPDSPSYEKVSYEARLTPERGPDGEIVSMLAISRNISGQKQVEAAEKEQRALAQALADSSAILNRTLDLDTMLDRILENVGKVAPHQGANIMLLEGDVARVRRYKGYEAKDGPGRHILDHGFPVRETATLRRMMKSRRPVTVADTVTNSDWTDVPGSNWFRSYAGAPIVQDDEVIGFLNLDAAAAGFFTEDHAQRLQAFANQVAVALRNAQLYEAEQRRRRVAETLAEAAATLNSTLALDEVLPLILEQLGRVIPYDSASVQEMEDGHLVIRAVKGFENPASNLNVVIEVAERYPNATIMATQQPMAVEDVFSEWPSFRDVHEVASSDRIRSWLGVPLLWNRQSLGLITVDRHRVDPFTVEEVKLAATFANHAATALHNARLYNVLKHSRDSLEKAVAARTFELQHTVDQLNAILNHSPEAILVLDQRGKIELGNPAVGRLFDYRRDEVIDQELPFLVNEDDREALLNALRQAKSTGHTQRLQLTAQRKGGFPFDADVALSPIQQSDGAFSIVCGMHDISGLKEVERMKDAFVSNVSHELRTPIASLKLYHGLLSRTDAKRDVYMARVEREIDRLRVTIEDLLRLSRLEQGSTQLQRQTVNLCALVEQYVTDRQLLAEQRKLSLQLGPCPMPEQAAEVQADVGLLGQVLSILLTNALNYTAAGGSVRAGVCHCRQGEQVMAGFYVSDTGTGIEPQERDKLFQRFYRGNAGKASGASGTGLGLSIAQQIVQQHQGTIDVQSEGVPGRGSTFTVWLPALPGPAEPTRH